MIGNCRTAALVGLDGSIDWLCWPRFDSGASFAALLGSPENGRWRLAPKSLGARVRRRYRPDTLILETEFSTDSGSATVLDFMPPFDDSAELVRIVVGRSGKVAFDTEFIVRFDYGSTVPWVTSAADGSIDAIAGPDRLVLRTPVELRGEDHRTVGEFTVRAGQRVPFVLAYGSSSASPPGETDATDALDRTESFWRKWIDRCPNLGTWTEAVKRSLITLKALAYQPTGGIVAAATTSLPERLGGVRNWDYRYCWLRDATFTLLAFMRLGYYEEALAWRDWLMRAVAGSPRQIQIVYGVGGERLLKEWSVPWLPGYAKSSPVRVGNDASEQLQLDVFGEIADAMFQALRAGHEPPRRAYAIRREMLEHLATTWREPDEGIWEVRGGPQHFVHSKVMAWVAFDRAAQDLSEKTFSDSARRWRRIADEIHAEVCERGFDRDLGSFVQAYDAKRLDASLLMLPLVGFLPASDPRVRGTLRAIRERLVVGDTFVRRYDTERTRDGLPPGEGAFLACSFWLVDHLALQGLHAEARRLFSRLLACRNDVGLLAEELDPSTGRMLGNFPQAYSHVGLINSALNLSRRTQMDRHESRARTG
jgi:GH15 family glucan-1,4-alpha-glucosidase